jgi:hypothetical protein
MRDLYRKIRISANCYETPANPMNFDEEIRRRAATIPGGLDPQGWLNLAKEVHEDFRKAWEKDRSRVECDKCRGSGVYGWGAYINGKPSFSGPCFRCEGKGYQTALDMRRNCYYDRYGIKLVS